MSVYDIRETGIVYCLAVGISGAGGVAMGAMVSASDGICGSGPSSATDSTWSMLSTKCNFIAVRRFSGTSATSFSFSCGRITSNNPARWAAGCPILFARFAKRVGDGGLPDGLQYFSVANALIRRDQWRAFHHGRGRDQPVGRVFRKAGR